MTAFLAANGNPISDVDFAALQGIAISAADSSHGTWQFSTNNGSTWTMFGSLSIHGSLLLAADANTRIRFIPTPGFSGPITDALTFAAWDQTDGNADGSLADTSVSGGTTAYSGATVTATIVVDVPPVVVGAYVSGTNWSQSYLSTLDSAGLGSPTVSEAGYRLADGAAGTYDRPALEQSHHGVDRTE